jgi:hypothetical protein
MPDLGTRPLAVLALLLALPASLSINTSFQPRDDEFRLQGRDEFHILRVDQRDAFFLEEALIVRAAGAEQPVVHIDLNGAPIRTVSGGRRYAPQTDKRPLPLEAIRTGDNQLRVWIDGAPEASFDMRAHLRNYAGIAPDFPRVYVVSDAAVAERNRTRGIALRLVELAACCGVAFLIVVGFARFTARQRSLAQRYMLLVAPSVVLWAAVVYSATSPVHVWLSLEATLVAVLVGWLIVGGVFAVVARRRAALTALAVAAVTITSLEIALRAFHFVRPSFVFYSDGYSRYRGKPGAPLFDSHFNSRGFNDTEYAPAKPPTVRSRIVAIGDSSTVGVVPYSANHLTLLESELADVGPVEVVNMGVSATTPDDYVDILAHEGLSCGPDLVLVEVFIGNDFEVRGRKPYEYSYVATFGRFLARLASRRTSQGASSEGDTSRYLDDAPSLPLERFLEIEVDRSWVYVDDLATPVARVTTRLEEMRDMARRRGASLAVVLIPDEAQVSVELQETVVRASGRDPGTLDFDRPNRLLTAALQAKGIDVLDLLPLVRRESNRARLYKPRDTHWNVEGNRLAATAIAPFVRQHLRK